MAGQRCALGHAPLLARPRTMLGAGPAFSNGVLTDRAHAKPSALFSFVIKATLHSDFAFWAATKVARDTFTKVTPLLYSDEDRPWDACCRLPSRRGRGGRTRARCQAAHSAGQRRDKGIWNDATISPTLPRYDLERIRNPTLLMAVCPGLARSYSKHRNYIYAPRISNRLTSPFSSRKMCPTILSARRFPLRSRTT